MMWRQHGPELGAIELGVELRTKLLPVVLFPILSNRVRTAILHCHRDRPTTARRRHYDRSRHRAPPPPRGPPWSCRRSAGHAGQPGEPPAGAAARPTSPLSPTCNFFIFFIYLAHYIVYEEKLLSIYLVNC
jgi:hypothetical protein